jgi:hypothetical protein
MLGPWLLSLCALLLATAGHAATSCVNPGGTGGCFASLQTAVDAALDNDLIEIEAGTYNGGFALSAKRLTITGAGADSVFITAPAIFGGLVYVSSRAKLTLSGVTLQNSDGNGVFVIGGRLALSDAVVTGSNLEGIAVSRKGKATIDNVTISGNGLQSPPPLVGGGLHVLYWNAKAKISNSTISGNIAALQGGGVNAIGNFRMENCTVSGNSGGGVWVGRKAKITSSTIANNSTSVPEAAGGVQVYDYTPQPMLPELILSGSIVADNAAPLYPDCAGNIRSKKYNLIEDASTCTFVGDLQANDVTGLDPMLAPLASNGGPTQTHALLPASPALDNVLSASLCDLDQRGQPRTVPCDSGAYEAP